MKRLNKKEQQLILAYGYVSEDKKRVAKKIVKRARKLLGGKRRIGRKKFVRLLNAGDEAALACLNAAASKHGDEVMAFFEPPEGGRDWAGFFDALLSCIIKFGGI